MSRPWRIGESMPRREDRALLRGEAGFFAASRSKADAWMVVVRSPVPHGRIEELDIAGAQAMPGVLLALTAGDLRHNGPLPAVDTLPSSRPAFQTVLAAEVVRYVGEPMVAVVAETALGAQKAGRAVQMRIEALPTVMSLDDAMAPATPALHGTRDPNSINNRVHHRSGGASGNTVHELNHSVGNPQAAFAAAAYVATETFWFHRVSACPLEPRGAECRLNSETGTLVVKATTQTPGLARAALARLLDLPTQSVAYEPLRLGGGFGLKEAVYSEEVLVAVAAQRLGRAVRWEETRAEHFLASSHAGQGRATVKVAFDADGIATALAVDGLSDIGAGYGLAGNSPGAAMGAMIRGPYRIPSLSARTRSVVTNKVPLNVYRGAGHPQAVFAMERVMDRAARELGLDRVEIRRRNLIPRDGFPADRHVSYPGAGHIVYDSGDFERCLDEALAAIDADGFEARRAAFERESPGSRLGLGLSLMVELTSTGPDESVALNISSDGRILVSTANVAIGQGAESALAQVLSAALAIEEDSIDVCCGGSSDRPSGGGTFASRGVSVCGAALADGTDRLKRKVIASVADLFAVPSNSLDWAEGGVVGLPGRNAPVTLPELLKRLPSGAHAAFSVMGMFRVSASSFASACHAAVVAVDCETGTVDVIDYAVAHDCGTVLNPANVDGQIKGGVMQGIGATLFEELPYDAAGQPLARSLWDYTLPVAANVPRFHLRHVETPSPLNPLGFKGAGEGGFTGTPAAVVGAIDHALEEYGLNLRDDGPYTPCRVLGLIRNASPAHPPKEPHP